MVGVLIPAFVSGLLLSWLYVKTRSIVPPIIAHAAQNPARSGRHSVAVGGDMPNRIDTSLEAARSAGKTALGPFVTVGYPDVETSVEVAASVLREGVDLIELGVPFSDPLAEGPTIQKTSYRALENGVDLPICLEAVRRLRGRGLETPIVFMGYYNPFLRYGLSRFASDAVAAGADGVIVPDLPTEESRDMRERCSERGLHLIPLLAPTSTDPSHRARLRQRGRIHLLRERNGSDGRAGGAADGREPACRAHTPIHRPARARRLRSLASRACHRDWQLRRRRRRGKRTHGRRGRRPTGPGTGCRSRLCTCAARLNSTILTKP